MDELQRQVHMDEIDLQEQVGKGGYGAVYKGTWRGAVVAVKYAICDVEVRGTARFANHQCYPAWKSHEVPHVRGIRIVVFFFLDLIPVKNDVSVVRPRQLGSSTQPFPGSEGSPKCVLNRWLSILSSPDRE